ncbi:MAG: DUF5057 domain-containing protein, partial [Turicibacter sp.]|nr:DUF5057 domain-containing protein [Turicibacter sp.]
QLVYLDREIYDESIEATKLYRNFIDKNGNPITGSNLITSETIKELTVEKIFEKYQTISYRQKQVDLTVVDNTPSDITTDDLDSADGIPSNRNRTMTVNIPIKENGEAENVELKLYLDLNGDGLFSDDEVAAQRTDLVTPLNDFELNYSIHPDFIGLLSWKLEVTKGDSNHPIKTYITGNINFHRLPGQPKKVIRVLQISNNENFMYADEEGTKSKPYDTLDLSRNTNFQQLLKQKELKDYEFSITIISLSAYNSIMKGEELPSWYPEAYQLSESEKLGIRKLNGYYDMVILGFADNYTNLGKDILEDKALNQLQNYVDTGQGLMLTHDTILYNEGNIEKLPSEGYKMLERFRVLSGQSRYAPLNQKFDSSIMFDPDRLEGISSDVCNSGETEEEKKINAAKCIMYSGGTTATLMNKWGSQEWATQTGNMSTLSTMVYGINQALITSYPFNLIDNINNTIAIRRTHGQYLQLNLEDEEVVPWFTNTYYNENNEGTHKDTEQYEVDNKINPYDVRNNYYTYSRKNITYSGTGEQKREYTQYPQSELMLFVNTIIKAERGANHAPSFEVKNLYNGMLVSDKQDTLIFDVIPYDMDLDNMRIEIEAYGCTSDHSCDTKIGDFKDNGDQYPRLNGESILVSLSIKDKVSLYETLQIRVKVIDEHGAESETVVYTLKVTDANLLEISLNSEGYLIGDTATLKANIKSVGSQVVDGILSLESIPSLVTLIGDKEFTFEFDKIGESSSTFRDYQFEVVNSDSIQTGNSTPVTISANYSYCLGEDSSSCARIEGKREGVINVKRGQIVLNFSSDVANLFQENNVEVQLLKADGTLVQSKAISSSNNVIFDAVPSGEYKIKIQSLEDYLLYELSDEEVELLEWGSEQEIAINYNNNVVIKNYFIDKASVDLVHGIFESQTNQAITIKETTDENPQGVTGNTLINFGATFTTTRISGEIVLNVSEMLNDFNKDNIKVLRVDKESSGLKLVPILGATVTEHQNVKTMFNIQLPNDIEVGTEILIFYTGLVPNVGSKIRNNIRVGSINKDVYIRVETNDLLNSYLPDLF